VDRQNDTDAEIRALKARLGGEVDVAAPDLARSLGDLGLIGEVPALPRRPRHGRKPSQLPANRCKMR
jgi:hypothetical protein